MDSSLHYQRRLVLQAPPATVFRLLTTTAGLRRWWTLDCEADGPAKPGSRLSFRFGRSHKIMQIESLVPERELRWRCVEALIEAPGITRKNEWEGTELLFRLSPGDSPGSSRLDFEHLGLTPALQCHTLCIQGWGHVLASLQAEAEQPGRGTPADGDCVRSSQATITEGSTA